MKMIKTIITVMMPILFICCDDQRIESSITVKLEKILEIGKEKGNENEIIGHPTDIYVNKSGELYLADYAFKNVKKYSSTGQFIKSFGKGEGKGPGEFLEPRGIDVDISGNVYVVDMKKRNITVFDSLGSVIYILGTKMQPTFVQAFSPEEVFVVGFPNTYLDELIYKYNLEKSTTDPVKKFGERYSGAKKFEIENSGFSSRILKINDSEKGILLSDYYPYRIIFYDNLDGEQFQLKRDVSFYKPPYIKSQTPLYVYPLAGSVGLIKTKNLIIDYIFYVDEENKIIKPYLDFWDINTKEFLGCISEKELGIKLGRYIFADSSGFFYNYENEPYPHITKYKLIIEKKTVKQ